MQGQLLMDGRRVQRTTGPRICGRAHVQGRRRGSEGACRGCRPVKAEGGAARSSPGMLCWLRHGAFPQPNRNLCQRSPPEPLGNLAKDGLQQARPLALGAAGGKVGGLHNLGVLLREEESKGPTCSAIDCSGAVLQFLPTTVSEAPWQHRRPSAPAATTPPAPRSSPAPTPSTRLHVVGAQLGGALEEAQVLLHLGPHLHHLLFMRNSVLHVRGS